MVIHSMLILIAHGSRDSRWRASIEQLAHSLQDRTAGRPVRLAYMECSQPTLQEVVDEAVEQRCATIHVLPLFLADQGHVERNIVPEVGRLQQAYDETEIRLLPSIGGHPAFLDMLEVIASQTGD